MTKYGSVIFNKNNQNVFDLQLSYTFEIDTFRKRNYRPSKLRY